MSNDPFVVQAGLYIVVSDAVKVYGIGEPAALTSRIWKNFPVPVAVKLTRAVAAVPAGSIPEVSVVERVLVVQSSSPEKTVSVPGGVLAPVAFLNSTE